MKTKSLSTLIMISCLFHFTSYAQKNQDTLWLDLALNDAGAVRSFQGNRSYDYIALGNAVAGYAYSIETNSEPELLPVLNFDDSGLSSSNLPKNDLCNTLVQKVKDLENYQNNSAGEIRSEKRLGEIVNNLKAELKNKECNDTEVRILAQKLLLTTQKIHPETIIVSNGDKVTITVKRDTLTWTFIFKGNERGKWVTTYGFGFTSSALERPTYFAKQVPDTNVFQILKARNPNVLDLNYVPAVFFSFFPSQNFNKTWNHSLSAGLGFDLTAPVVFLGFNTMFWHNIGISTGIAFQQQYRLKDQYSEDEIISQTLDKDQLHDRVYSPNLFFSVNFRLGENPFEKKQTDTEE